MANTLRFKRGLVSGIPTAALGEPLFTTDTFDLYIGNGTGNTRFQKYIASGTTSQLLRGDGSLLTMPIVLTSPSNGQVLKYDGTNWVNSSDAGVTGSGANGQVTFWNSASTITGSNNLFWDNTNGRLGINRPSPSYILDIGSSGLTIASVRGGSSTNQSAAFYVTKGDSSGTLTAYGDEAAITGGTPNLAAMLFTAASIPLKFYLNGALRMTLNESGRLLLGSATDNGLRFQVTGDGYFSGSVGVGSSALTSIGLRVAKTITGGTLAYAVLQDGQVQSDVTNQAHGFYNTLSTQATSFTLSNYYHYRAFQGTIGAGSAVTNQYGFFVQSNLTGATSNYGFYGDIASGTGRWNLYMNGTAANFLSGNLSVGDTTSIAAWTKAVYVGNSGTNKLIAGYLASSTNGAAIGAMGTALSGWSPLNIIGNSLLFHSAGEGVRMTLDASGNLGLGVTPSAWSAGQAAIQGSGWAITQTGVNNTYYIQNANYNGTNWIYRNSFAASFYLQQAGSHQFWYAPVGTAGNVVSWTQGMTLFATGNFTVGNNVDAGFKLDVNGTMRVSGASTFNGNMTNAFASLAGGTTVIGGITGVSNGFRIDVDTSNQYQYSFRSGTNTTLFQIANTGAATFSSSVTAGHFIATTPLAAHLTSAGALQYSANGVSIRAYGATAGTGFFTIRTGGGGGSADVERVVVAANGNVGFNSTTLFVDAVNDRVGIGTTSPTAKLDVVGAATFSSSVTGASFIPTSSTIPTNGMYLSAANTLAFATASGNKLTISSTGLATFSDSARFSNLKGCIFVQTGGSLLGSISMDSSNQVTIDNNGFFGISVGSNYTMTGGNLGIGHSSFGTSATRTISVVNGTAPSTSPTDAFQMYSNDVVAGNAAPHFRTENGAVIKLYQETTAVGNAIISLGGGNAVLDDTTFDGYTLRQIVRALRNQGILA